MVAKRCGVRVFGPLEKVTTSVRLLNSNLPAGALLTIWVGNLYNRMGKRELLLVREAAASGIDN